MREERDRQWALIGGISVPTTWSVAELHPLRNELDQLAQKYTVKDVVDHMVAQHTVALMMRESASPHLALQRTKELLEHKERLRLASERVNAFVRSYGTRRWRRW